MPKARNAPCADLKCQGEEMVQLDTPVQYSVCPGLSPRVPASVVILRVLVFFFVHGLCTALLVLWGGCEGWPILVCSGNLNFLFIRGLLSCPNYNITSILPSGRRYVYRPHQQFFSGVLSCLVLSW